MTKTLLTGLALFMVASALTTESHALPRSESKSDTGSRTVEVRYEAGAIPFLACVEPCPKLRGKPGERYVTVEVIDDFSPTGYVSLVWDYPDGQSGQEINVCGEEPTPQRIRESAELTIYPWMVPGPARVGRSGCATGFSTSGTVRITFSRHPMTGLSR